MSDCICFTDAAPAFMSCIVSSSLVHFIVPVINAVASCCPLCVGCEAALFLPAACRHADESVLQRLLELLELDGVDEGVDGGVAVAEPEHKLNPVLGEIPDLKNAEDRAESVGEEEREPAREEHHDDDDKGLGSIDVVLQVLVSIVRCRRGGLRPGQCGGVRGRKIGRS